MSKYVAIKNQFIPEEYDNIDFSYPDSTTDVLTFKKGNVTVVTVTITYTDSSKDVVSNIARS